MKVNSHCHKNPLSKVYLGTNELNGVSLDRITQFRLWACPAHTDHRAGQPVTVEIALGNAKGKLRLFTFLPWGMAPSGYVGYGKWREIDLKSGGAWELTNVALADSHGDWAWLVRRYPGFGLTTPPAKDWPAGTISGTGLNIKIGGPSAVDREHEDPPSWHQSSGCECYVDKLIIGYLDDTGKEIVTTYDFEPDTEQNPADSKG